ncbi:MAG: class I SAM-dependent methyltransferase [Pedobacter sp.]|nr:MAG: class I SAM-dependent methyltransferase [Pedobacter sp.]
MLAYATLLKMIHLNNIFSYPKYIYNVNSAKEVLPHIFETFKHDSVVDVGCGPGDWLKVSKDLGTKKILGIDEINVDKQNSNITSQERITHNLNLPFDVLEKYDIAFCLEVVEHLPIESSKTIINTLTSLSDVILFSAAIPHQGGNNHINEQWPSYWQSFFFKNEFIPIDLPGHKLWDSKSVEWWYKQNMIVYVNRKKALEMLLNPLIHIPIYIREELYISKINEINDLRNEIELKDSFIQQKISHLSFLSKIKKLVRSTLGF